MYQVFTDTSANLEAGFLREHSIKTVPFSFFVDGKEQVRTDDEEFDGKAFFDAMRKGVQVTTSQVTPQRYIEYFSPVL